MDALPPSPPPPPPSSYGASPEAKPPTNGLAIAALVTAIVGICVPCLGPIAGLALGVIALFKIKGTQQRGQGLAIAAIVISVVFSVMNAGITAAIAIPNFIKFQARAKQAECKSNLRALHAAQQSFYAEHDRYTEDPEELGFSLQSPHRYSYFLSADPAGWMIGQKDSPTAPDLELATPGVHGECPDCGYVAMCVGQADQDPDLDMWVISSRELELANGESAPAGEPVNLRYDVEGLD